MKTSRLSLVWLLAVGGLVVSCVQPTGSTGQSGGAKPLPASSVAGKFAVEKFAGAPGTARSIGLGTYTINDSQTIFFILKNVGSRDITNVVFTLENYQTSNSFTGTADSFTILPDTSTTPLTLQPVATSSFDTLVSVHVNHGSVYNQVGQSSFLDPSFVGVSVHIAGSTTDGTGATVATSEDIDIGTIVNLARFEIWSSTDGFTSHTVETSWSMDKVSWGGFATLPTIGPATYANGSHYPTGLGSGSVASSGKALRLVNSGNVDFSISSLDNNQNLTSWTTIPHSGTANYLDLVPFFASSTNTHLNTFEINTLGYQYDNRPTKVNGIPELNFLTNTSILQFNVEGIN